MPDQRAAAAAADSDRSQTHSTAMSGIFTSTGKCDPVVTEPAPTIPIFKRAFLAFFRTALMRQHRRWSAPHESHPRIV